MQFSKIKNLLSKKITKYIVVLILYLGVFLFGRNFDSGQQVLIDQVSELSRNTQGYYQLIGRSEFVANREIGAEVGELIRINFDLLSRKTSFRDDGQEEKTGLEIFAVTKFGEEKLIDIISTGPTLTYQKKEVQFVADKEYQKMVIRKISEDNFKIEIGAISINRSSMPTVGQGQFKSTIFGQSRPEAMNDRDLDINSQFVRLWRKDEKIGEIFTAQSDNLYGVEFKTKFYGSGGSGNYLIELREVNENNQIGNERLAYWYFDKKQLESEGSVSKDTYFLPIVARLEIGKKYCLGFSSSEVSSNWFNSISIATQSSDTEVRDDPIDKSRILIQDIDLRLFMLKKLKYLENELLFGSSISFDADGEVFYTYEQLGRPAEYLDIYSVEGERPKYSVIYDNIAGVISGQLSKDTAFVYRFNTIYPYTKAFMSFQEVDGSYLGAKAFWSTDGKNWNEIIGNNFSNPNNPIKFNQQIAGNNSNEIFLKISYDLERQSDKKVNLFGIKNLIINANLDAN